MRSLSARRAWIEIIVILPYRAINASLSARRAWIEIGKADVAIVNTGSLSARRAWIEIRRAAQWVLPSRVALRKESVDRNTESITVATS